jgi:hypothetical protein
MAFRTIHKQHVLRILREADEALSVHEVASCLNWELGRKAEPYTDSEVGGLLKDLVTGGRVIALGDGRYMAKRRS